MSGTLNRWYNRSILTCLFILCCSSGTLIAQNGSIAGRVTGKQRMPEQIMVTLLPLNKRVHTDSAGFYRITQIPFGRYRLQFSGVGFEPITTNIHINSEIPLQINQEMVPLLYASDEVVVTGTMKEISRSESPVPVELFTPKLFRKNPTSCLFESIGMVNGVKPQINCNVCNTGDIHINGMEGPYTLVLIDGMPIVSALASVYGLSGIPNSLVERIEIVKGPASSLYGSEAMGGIINVITKTPRQKTPAFTADFMATGWGELNTDLSLKYQLGKKISSLLGINHFKYGNRRDDNGDGFTDVTLQHRVSLFNKWNLARKDNRQAGMAARFFYEDRWGGQTNWNRKWRGSDSIYGESIYTHRFELIGHYQLPVKENIQTWFSVNHHNQDSWYGNMPYKANQQVAFVQAYWDKPFSSRYQLLLGSSFRFTRYDDNTPATASADGKQNAPALTPLPGIFLQNEWKLNNQHTLLAGYRYDYDRYHGSIHSPRLAYKWSANNRHALRASLGTGFRVVNIFTEEHAALTGGREVVITETLNPERSFNSNLNYVLKIPGSGYSVNLDFTGFHTYFSNKITGDFDTDPNRIIYQNLDGHAVSRGMALNTEIAFHFPLKILSGISFMDVFMETRRENGRKERVQQLHAPKWSGTFTATYNWPRVVNIDITAQWNGPMRLPVLPNDFRPEYSPWHCIANIQLSRKMKNGFELYGGIKNLLNFIPKNPIMRPFDPFDKYTSDPVNNPNNYTFDPSYNYASLQGVRGFIGVRYQLTE